MIACMFYHMIIVDTGCIDDVQIFAHDLFLFHRIHSSHAIPSLLFLPQCTTISNKPNNKNTQQVNPVTHAVGNTIKRVVIIVASVIAFKTPMSTGSIIGSSVAIAGTLMYSLAMNAAKEKKE